MPRKSRFDEKKNGWNTALYIRLSREDGDKEESDSISNQRDILLSFVDDCEDLKTYDIYIDDDYSGTNFERPGFLRMMADIKNGDVNCVAVKDLSRFGRNYIEAGNYIEQIFPFLNVRFISVNDSLDSVKNPEQMDSIIVPFKNLINDEYARDISKKVRSVLDNKRKRGEFIGSFAAYGYLKDRDNRNRLVIDQEAAPVIRNIYNWYIEGYGFITIAKKLNEMGILNPSAYKKSQGMNYHHPVSAINSELWSDSSVKRILLNQVYIGHTVQGKNKIQSYKVRKAVAVPQDEWIVVENTHEAIIERDVWEKVQNLYNRDKRTSPNADRVYLFSGLLICADCNRAMNIKNISQPYKYYSYYVCSTYKKFGPGNCTNHTIRTDKLEFLVYEAIKKQVEIAVDMDRIIKEINGLPKINLGSRLLNDSLEKQEDNLSRIKGYKKSIYEDWKNGDITREEYLQYKDDYEVQIEKISAVIESLNDKIKKAAEKIDDSNLYLTNFIKYKNFERLTREIVVSLIDKIKIHENKEITIVFNFASEYDLVREYITQNEYLLEQAN